jgi:O-acetyl-ADP-ribose deacetylase (regulator of RNase III)
MSYMEIDGDLIKLAKEGMFDVIAHGCNCMCTMKSGIAPQMANAFGCNLYPLEAFEHRGDIQKLGMIDYKAVTVREPRNVNLLKKLYVVNAYTQYAPRGVVWATDADSNVPALDYEALALCLRKINHIFAGQHVGLPKIGAGLAGGDWERIKQIIQIEFTKCDVTVVNYKPI